METYLPRCPDCNDSNIGIAPQKLHDPKVLTGEQLENCLKVFCYKCTKLMFFSDLKWAKL